MSDISHTKNFFHLYAEDKDMLKQYIKESLSNLENFLFLEKEKAFIKSGEDLPSPLLPE